jgi:acyl dehydratase
MQRPIDIDKLMRFEIPTGRQIVTPEAIALYALSVGVGCDPLDLDQLGFVDPLRGPAVLPSMVLTMAHPGFWMSDPRSGVDPEAVLHASQSFAILGDLPRSGLVESRSRVTDVFDKGAGAAALVLAETDLHDESGRLFARLERVTFVRNGGGFGGRPAPAHIRAGAPDTAPDHVVDLATAPAQALLYRLNGDLNPLHSDPVVAARAGFAAPILHGLCTMGVVTHAVLAARARYRSAALRSLRLRFCAPVFPGETIRTEIWNDGRFRALIPTRGTVVVDDGLAELAEVDDD